MKEYTVTYTRTVEETVEAEDAQAAIDASNFSTNDCSSDSLTVTNPDGKVVYENGEFTDEESDPGVR